MDEKYFINNNLGRVGNKSHISFIPAIDINCNPPYLTGKRDSCWVNIKNVNKYNKKMCEKIIGMSLLPIK